MGNCSASRGLPNIIQSDRIFNSYRMTITVSFFLCTFPSTIAFRLEYVLFYQFYTKIIVSDQEMFGSVPLLYVDVAKRLSETHV